MNANFGREVLEFEEYMFYESYNVKIKEWIERLDEFSELLGGKIPLTLANYNLFDSSLLFGFTNREHILTLLCDIKDDVFLNLRAIESIRHPIRYIFGTSKFEMNIDNNYITRSPCKYLSNYDARLIIQDSLEILNQVTGNIYDQTSPDFYLKKVRYNGKYYSSTEMIRLLREAALMKNFLTEYSTSKRILSMYKLIQIVFETSNFCNVRGFKYTSNPILATFKRLYAGYSNFPFREIGTSTEFNEQVSMILPELSYALVELWFKYVLIDMTKEELYVGINILLEWSTTSLDECLLNFKDCRTNIIKLLINHTVTIRGILHNGRTMYGIIEEKAPCEIWEEVNYETSASYLNYVTDFMKYSPHALTMYLRKIGILLGDEFSNKRVISSLEEVKRLYIVINVICQHGLFIKNPVILTLDKSILPRGSISMAPSSGTLIENRNVYNTLLTYQLDWTTVPIFREMWYEGVKLIQGYVEKYDKLDLEAEFIKALTTNSGGVEYQPTKEEEIDIPGNILKTFGKKRLMYFLLNPVLYTNYSTWIEALKSVTSSGERKQVDRRGRVIQMVSNAAQIAPFLLFLLVDIMGKNEKELSSKKNSGTIRDINVLLRATSNMFSVQESADISGMDASTTRVMTSFINNLVGQVLQQCSHKRYFFAQRERCDVYNMKNEVVKYSHSMDIHPGVLLTQLSEVISESYNYKLSIPELSAFGRKIVVDTSPNVFPSGKFSTNAQHSLLNMLILRVLRNMLIPKLLEIKIPVSKMECKVSGDDIFVSFETRTLRDEGQRLFSKSLLKIFTEVGFKIGSMLSRYGAVFLQQSAVFGTVLPKPDRISLTTSERGESLKTHIYEGFGEFRDIVKELTGRVHFPMNTRYLLNAVANQCRRIRTIIPEGSEVIHHKLTFLYYKEIQTCLNFCLEYNLSKKWIPIRLIPGKRYAHIVLPVISLFLSTGFDLPFLPTYFQHFVPKANIFTPRGSISDWKLRNILRIGGTSIPKYTLSDQMRKQLLDAGINHSDIRKSIKGMRVSQSSLEVDIMKFIRLMYNHKLADFLGLNWFKYINKFNLTSVLERMRLAKFPRRVREEWASGLMFRLNFNAIVRSRLAGMKLENAGYKTSKRLAFYNSPHERITQAIVSGNDSLQEFRSHRFEFLYYMIHFPINISRDYWLEDVEYETILLQEYRITIHPIKCRREFIIDLYGGLMLSSGRDIDRDTLLYKFGHNFYDVSMQFSGYYGLTPGPYKDYKHDDLVKFASKVYHDRPDLLHLVWEFANVHSRYRKELEKIIQFGEMSELSPWKSIAHTRQTFEISTSFRNNHKIWAEEFIEDRRIQRILGTIARDIAYCDNSIVFFKPKLILALPFLLIHSGIRSRIKSLLSLGISSP
uniref:RNA-directed RNA polymerase n=1 Tax=Reoviridae sp. BF02/7/10 TaxID=2511768 RepID=A0A411DB94_9REOV|nr:RNA-dependent RNA polymerase [Reoviridae sp. BF02/7/10]